MHKEVDVKIQELLLSRFLQNDERIDNWLKTVAKNYYYKNSPFVDEFGNYIDDIDNNKFHTVDNYTMDMEILSKIRHIIDYLKSDSSPLRISRLSFIDAERLSSEWVKLLNKKSSIKEEKGDVCFIKELEFNYFIVKLITEQSYKREGKIMGHCIASYYDGNDSVIYSLRDKNNNPCCTVETYESNDEDDDNQILEIEGRFNKSVQDKHVDAAKEMISFLISKLQILPETIDDLEKINSFAVNDRVISMDEISSIPENTIVESYLHFHTDDEINIELPKGLIFKNSVSIKTAGSIKISDDVIFEGKLMLSSVEIEFSNSVNYKGNELRIIDCKKLNNYPIVPDELDVLMLDRTNISYIPKNLKSVKTLSFCDNHSIKKIDNICAQTIDFRASGILSIGKNVEAQTIKLRNTKILLKNISSEAKVSNYKIDEGHEVKKSLKYKFLKEELFAEIKIGYKNLKYKIKNKFKKKKHVYMMGSTGSGKTSNFLHSQKKVNLEDIKLPVLHHKKKSVFLSLKELLLNKSNQSFLVLTKILKMNKILNFKNKSENNKKENFYLGYSKYQIMDDSNCRKVNYKNTTFEYKKENIHINGIVASIKRGLSNNIEIRPSDEPPAMMIFDEYAYYAPNNRNDN
jgi:hypothetical protein